ncbi:MAG TPA: Na+/H+ antiporter subunit E [Acidimicrobiia bacterium]|nr:Na+/H+ antiporter subunit E [Acidimicrobiia bacterium]
MRYLWRAVWLIAVWLFLWGEITVGNLVGGSLVATLVLYLFKVDRVSATGAFRPLAALHFMFYFLVKLVEASLVVAWEVVTPRNRINEGIVAVPLAGVSDLLTTMVANSISLTPGTLTIDVGKDARVLYVHVLHLRSVEQVRREVYRLELLAIKAFGSDEAVDELMTSIALRNRSGKEVDG